MSLVLCPYCGSEMEWSRTYYSGLMPGEHVTFWWECECGAKSPARESEDDAFAAAQTLAVVPKSDVDIAYKDGYDTGYQHGGNKNARLPRGRWEYYADTDMYGCSNCRAMFTIQAHECPNLYCRFCGARMDAEASKKEELGQLPHG